MHPIRYFQPWTMWRRHDLRPTYDVVIVGGGAHGMAIAYELAKRGIHDVAVLEKSYIGAGGSGRNTTIVRANYRTPEGVAFYKEALRLYGGSRRSSTTTCCSPSRDTSPSPTPSGP